MTKIREGKEPRRTKIIATLGPATDDEAVLAGLLQSGVDAVRLNFSHGDAEDHLRRARKVRQMSADLRYHVGLIGDLQGPKIRIERFAEDSVELKKNQEFILDASLGRHAGTDRGVGLTYKALHKDISSGDILLLDDGRVELEVVAIENGRIVTKVQHDAVVSSSKGLNRKGGGLSASSITEKDHDDIRLAAEIGIDYLAVSFPESAADINYARKLLNEAGCAAGMIAKIERAEALKNIDEIIDVSDSIMIARGDLNLEIGDAELIAVQKRLINLSRLHNRIAITATEMMQSMISNPRPTRAEISDIANAVLDGTDVVMLSGETATGRYPVEAVETMSRICEGAESADKQNFEYSAPDRSCERVDEAIALAAIHTGRNLQVAAIVALTESGSSALWMSRQRSFIPIYALTSHETTCRKVTLYRGVYPGLLDNVGKTHDEVNHAVVDIMLRTGAVEDGDLMILTKGDLIGKRGGTNAMKVLRVGNLIKEG